MFKKPPLKVVLIIGSGVDALRAKLWDKSVFQDIVAINNAWQILPNWNYLIHPEDFPVDRMPSTIDAYFQKVITAEQYVPIQNAFGGFVYAGATMAFTAGYWALGALNPDIIAFVGCDMVYEQSGPTHFYGKGTPDPLRPDITLQSLEAKSVRLLSKAVSMGCVCLNLSIATKSRLLFPAVSIYELGMLYDCDQRNLLRKTLSGFDRSKVLEATQREDELNYMTTSGKYWEDSHKFNAMSLYELDQLWLDSYQVKRHRLVA